MGASHLVRGKNRGRKGELSGLPGGSALRFFYGLLAVGMISVSLYLVNHYYEVHFPQTLVSGSMCDLSSFWNCDTATLSPMASFFHVPTAVFGCIVGLFFLVGACVWRRDVEQVNYLLSVVNALGCVGLFGYSLVVLDGLCPGCTVYYVLSVCLCGLFIFRRAPKWHLQLNWRVLAGYLFVGLVVSGGFYSYTKSQDLKFLEHQKKILQDFRNAESLEPLKLRSQFRLASATEKFEDAPLRVTVFSDFQCPICKVFAEETLPKLVRRYKGKLNMQYVFYPMDSNCNHNIEQPMHPMACEASYLAACLPGQFHEIHDRLYASQNELSYQLMQRLANEYKISKCYNDDNTQKLVQQMVLMGDKASVRATPTTIVNGKPVEGLLPLKFYVLLFDDAIAQSQASNEISWGPSDGKHNNLKNS